MGIGPVTLSGINLHEPSEIVQLLVLDLLHATSCRQCPDQVQPYVRRTWSVMIVPWHPQFSDSSKLVIEPRAVPRRPAIGVGLMGIVVTKGEESLDSR